MATTDEFRRDVLRLVEPAPSEECPCGASCRWGYGPHADAFAQAAAVAAPVHRGEALYCARCGAYIGLDSMITAAETAGLCVECDEPSWLYTRTGCSKRWRRLASATLRPKPQSQPVCPDGAPVLTRCEKHGTEVALEGEPGHESYVCYGVTDAGEQP